MMISPDDVKALQAMRAVIADAAHHPGRDAALAALDRIGATPELGPAEQRTARPLVDLSHMVGGLVTKAEFAVLDPSQRTPFPLAAFIECDGLGGPAVSLIAHLGEFSVRYRDGHVRTWRSYW